ncbi:DNA-binding response regulator [Ktedonobacter sp. SOSP1-52]|uniref:response regulator transcription factor n=1 Tax=Ktedonobacter sp. SOSP1-52 TaxID=2778366 RepID=UPI001915C057|nr:response regulator transcription factor [Ktedonobacter sp. SOSP1-52]GHO64072.1 DNA-binding response regulator [Ktedonobacter sp. SOSP1-52]
MNQEKKHIRVIIADDHLIVREGLRFILETDPEIELVGDASDGTAAVRLAGEIQPDVILMDLRMPGLDGLQAIEQIHAHWPQIALVILTTYHEDSLMLRGLQAGACGYLLKDISREMLLDAIRTAARGETLLQPDVLSRLLAQTFQVQPAPDTPSRRGVPSIILTEREQEVLQAIARGERSKEIAAHLGIAERTVKSYLSGIYTKLEVDSRAAAVAKAIAKGLLLPHNGS